MEAEPRNDLEVQADQAANITLASTIEERSVPAADPIQEPDEVLPAEPSVDDQSNEIRAEPVVLIERIPGEGTSRSPGVVQQPGSSGQGDPTEGTSSDQPNDSQSRKRKSRARSGSKTPPREALDEDTDDGSICPICLDTWEMSGNHRLTSLKCGHLFGLSCIKRWLQGCLPGAKVCPTCKTKAALKDMRYLYAKRICAVDKSEEYRLNELLHVEKVRNSKLLQDVGMLRIELAMSKRHLSQVEVKLENMRRSTAGSALNEVPLARLARYKLAKDKGLDMAKGSGCRVLLSGRRSPTLVISQKSNQSLFPGFGVRILDVRTFQSTNFLHMSPKAIRDLCYSHDEDLIVSATLENCAKLFNVADRTVVNTFIPSDKPIWACALDTEPKNFVYLGSAVGSTYVYDTRNPNAVLEEFKNEDDMSPVIAIATVPTSAAFPFGGFLVCKLQSLWFHEYMASQQVRSTRLNIEGPFVSMSYDAAANSLLAATRASTKHCLERYIVSKLVKVNDMSALDTIATFDGSRVTPVMCRSSQIIMEDTTLVTAYLQDRKILGLWNLTDNYRTQSLPIPELVYDMCPIYDSDTTYVAGLSEDKCRIYKVLPE